MVHGCETTVIWTCSRGVANAHRPRSSNVDQPSVHKVIRIALPAVVVDRGLLPQTVVRAHQRSVVDGLPAPTGIVAGVTFEWMLDLAGSEPLRSIIAVTWSLLCLTLAFAVIVGVPVAIGVSEQRRGRS
jgi:hypothetical protein